MSGSPDKLTFVSRPTDAAKVRALFADDMRWIVREMPAPKFDRRGGTHLLFEADGVMRRVRTFPATWHELPDAQLYALTDRIRLVD